MSRIVEKYSDINVISKDYDNPIYIIVTFANPNPRADKGPGKPSPFKYISFIYTDIPYKGPTLSLPYMSESRLKTSKKQNVKDMSQDAFQYLVKSIFNLKQLGHMERHNILEFSAHLRGKYG